MAAFKQWVKKCFNNLVDPDKGSEVAELTAILREGIAKQKKTFVIARALENRPHQKRHLDQARRDLFKTYLTRAWKDGTFQADEKETLDWIARRLEFRESDVRQINLEFARPMFAEALAGAMDDGVITAAEAARLNEIAKFAGTPLRQFIQEFFQAEGEAFLRGVFAAAVVSERSVVETVEHMVTSAAKLGLERKDVMNAIRPQAIRYVEHALADAKEDDTLTAEEDASLVRLLQIFELPNELREYVLGSLAELRLLTNIRRGKLPSLDVPIGVSVRAGELVHYHGRAVWECLRMLKSGPSIDRHDGLITITDSRMIFSSPTRSDSFSFSRVVGYDSSHGAIEVQLQGKPEQRFACGGRLPPAIFASAIRMANQSLINQDESRRSRHISRDVRQRVWQRYGGRCAECDATSYLEFDHIVPVAKGGSNSDSNVQLLCRNCNLKKSDMI